MAEALGFLASGLVLLTFGMRTMLPMRLLAICSNLAFITYGLSLGLTPVWALHGVLLPLNLYRLRELSQGSRRGVSAPLGEWSLEALRPIVAQRRFAAGEVLFRKGELAHELFYILKGRIRLRDIDGRCGAGEPLGGLGLSAPGGRRTATAVCETDCELLVVSDVSLQLAPRAATAGVLGTTSAKPCEPLSGCRVDAEAERLIAKLCRTRPRPAGGPGCSRSWRAPSGRPVPGMRSSLKAAEATDTVPELPPGLML